MDKKTFSKHLDEGRQRAIFIARQSVLQHLPDETRFLLYPNQSYDGNALVDDEKIYPQESLPEDKYLGPFTAQQVIEYLWRKGKVPEWVNLSVQKQDEQFTYIEVLCCGRYSANEENLYHIHEGYRPSSPAAGRE